MEAQSFQELELTRIGRCPFQARKTFDIEDLVPSVRARGVIEPILVRPVEPYRQEGEFPTAGNIVDHQLVAGERRFRAMCQVAFENGSVEAARIPAMVRVLIDDDAFDIATIENLHRRDLNELEEAEGFKSYVERHGSGDRAVETLAERVGVSSKYIRRRLRLLALPAKVLEAWGAGKIQYGYLDQLVRIRDPERLEETFQKIVDRDWDYQTVDDVKNEIDSQAPSLKGAIFNLRKEGCSRCEQNSEYQRKELGIEQDLKGAFCLERKCFKQKQAAHLAATWEQSAHHAKHKTSGFRFQEDVGYKDYEIFQEWKKQKPAKKCFECESFVTLLTWDGRVNTGSACVGDKGCFREVQASGKDAGGKPGKRAEDAPRATWHGDLFRDKFFKDAIREKLSPEAQHATIVIHRVILAALCKSNSLCQRLFLEEFGGKKPEYIEDDKVWKIIHELDSVQVEEALLVCSREVILDGPFNYGYCKARPAIAEYLGIDLIRDYRLTVEYLEKKTIGEIQALAKEHQLWKREEAQEFLVKILKKKPGQFSTCKKPELIRVILESGMDLMGVVPKEILGKGTKK